MSKRRKPMQVTVETIFEQHGLTKVYREALNGGEPLHLRLERDGFMPLVIEVFRGVGVSVAHYFTQNGDAMRDPEIVFNPDTWHGVEITQDPIGRYQRVPEGKYSPGIESLARMWAKNLRSQGFTGTDVVATSLTHDAHLQTASN